MGYAVLLGWAVLGTALSAALHLYAFAPGYRPVPGARAVLIASAVGLMITGLLDRQRLRLRAKVRGWWKAAVEASPHWLRWVNRVAFLYIVGFFALDTLAAFRSQLVPETAVRAADKVLGALLMVVHAVTFTLVYELKVASRQARERSAEPPAGPG